MTVLTPTAPAWQVGDAFTLDGTRWAIRDITASTGQVRLEAMSTTNHGIWWTTDITNLPRKADA